jgi:hypothetical protein
MSPSRGRVGRFIRWLFRTDQKLDPVLERRLQKNREALEQQRQKSAQENAKEGVPDLTKLADTGTAEGGRKAM